MNYNAKDHHTPPIFAGEGRDDLLVNLGENCLDGGHRVIEKVRFVEKIFVEFEGEKIGYFVRSVTVENREIMNLVVRSRIDLRLLKNIRNKLLLKRYPVLHLPTTTYIHGEGIEGSVFGEIFVLAGRGTRKGI